MISYFSDLPCLVYKFGTQQLLDLFDVITWSLLNRRNKSRLNEACVLLNRFFDLAKSYLKEFQHHRVPPMKQQCPRRLVWNPLDHEDYKTNCDGAVFANKNEVGLRVVVCDSQGKILASLSEKITIPSNVMTLEILATRQAIQFAQEISIHHSTFEGDNEIAINVVRNGDMLSLSFDHLVKDTLSYASSFQSFSFFHTYRQGDTWAFFLEKLYQSKNLKKLDGNPRQYHLNGPEEKSTLLVKSASDYNRWNALIYIFLNFFEKKL